MNKSQLEGKLKQVKGDAKIWWGKTTHNLETELEGNKDKIHGNLLEQKGDLEEKFDSEMKKFEKAKHTFEKRTEEVNDSIKSKWEKFTHQDVADIDGSFENFSNKIKEKYNKTQEEANAEVREFMAKFK